MRTTARVSISREGLECEEVQRALMNSGIACAIVPNHTVQCGGGRCWSERGCCVVQSVASRREIETTWNTLRNSFNVGCAHLSVSGGLFEGCILDYMRPTICRPEENYSAAS